MYGNKYINIILDGYGGNTMEAVVNIDWIEGKGTKTIVYNTVKKGLINGERETKCVIIWVEIWTRGKQFVKTKSR